MFSLLRFIFLIIVLIIALSFFGVSLQSIVTSPASQANYNYVSQVIMQAWEWLAGLIRPIA